MRQDTTVEAVPPPVIHRQVEDVPVCHGDALGRPRGTGSEHHVGRALRVLGRGRGPVRLLLVLRVDHQDMGEQGTGASGRRGVGQYRSGPTEAVDVPQPFVRLIGVQGYVISARLEHGQRGQGQLRRPAVQQGHRDLRAHPLVTQPVGQVVGPPIQCTVGHGDGALDERGRVGCGGGPLGEGTIDRGAELGPGAVSVVCVRFGRSAPGGQQLVFPLVQEIEFGQRAVGFGHRLSEQGVQTSDQGSHRLRGEHVGRVFDEPLHPLR